MSNHKTKTFGIITTLVVIVLVVVFTVFRTRNSSDVLRVGYMRIASHAPLISAVENKIFDKYNLDVKAEYYPTTADLIDALEQKKIDVAFQVTPDLAWKSSSKTKDDYYIYFVARSTKEKPMDGLYAMTPLTRDLLLHQTVGHFPGLTGKYVTQEILKQGYNLNPTEYTLIDANPAMQMNLLKRGEIRALFTYEPLGTIAVNSLKAENVIPAPVEKHIIDPWNGGIGIFSSDLVKYKKEVAVKFQQAIEESYSLLDKDLNLYVTTLMDLQPGLTIQLAQLVPNISLIFSTDKKNTEEIRTSVAEQFKMYQDLGILDKNDSHYLKIFEPYEK